MHKTEQYRGSISVRMGHYQNLHSLNLTNVKLNIKS